MKPDILKLQAVAIGLEGAIEVAQAGARKYLESGTEKTDELFEAATQGLEKAHGLRAEQQLIRKFIDVLKDAEVLAKHGIFVKMFDRVTVANVLDRFDADLVDKEAIITHVMEGDGWQPEVLTFNDDDEQRIWGIIRGTAGDHPEWFGEEALKEM